MHKRTASEKLSLNPEISRPPSGQNLLEKKQKKQNGQPSQVFNTSLGSYNTNNKNKMLVSNTSQKSLRDIKTNSSSKSQKAITLNLASKAKIVKNLQGKYFNNDDSNNTFSYNDGLKTDIDKKVIKVIDTKNQKVFQLEDKLKKLENDNLDYMNRTSADANKIKNLNKELRNKDELVISLEKELNDKVNFLNNELKLIKSDTSYTKSKDKNAIKDEYRHLKEKCEDLKILNQKKDNIIEIFLFFLNNIQIFLQNHNVSSRNHNFKGYDLYTLKGVMNIDSIEFKKQISIIETVLFNLSSDIENNGFDIIRSKNSKNSNQFSRSISNERERNERYEKIASPLKSSGSNFKSSPLRELRDSPLRNKNYDINTFDKRTTFNSSIERVNKLNSSVNWENERENEIMRLAKEKEAEREREWKREKDKRIREREISYKLELEKVARLKDNAQRRFEEVKMLDNENNNIKLNNIHQSSRSNFNNTEYIRSRSNNSSMNENFSRSRSQSKENNNRKSNEVDYSTKVRNQNAKKIIEHEKKVEREFERQKLYEKDRELEFERDRELKERNSKQRLLESNERKIIRKELELELKQSNISVNNKNKSFKEEIVTPYLADENRYKPEHSFNKKQDYPKEYSPNRKIKTSEKNEKYENIVTFNERNSNSQNTNQNETPLEVIELRKRVSGLEKEIKQIKKESNISLERTSESNYRSKSNSNTREDKKSTKSRKLNTSNNDNNDNYDLERYSPHKSSSSPVKNTQKSKLSKNYSNSPNKMSPNKSHSRGHSHASRRSPLHERHQCDIHTKEYFYGDSVHD